MQLRTHNTVKMLTSSSYPNKTSDISGLPFCMKEKSQNIILNINVLHWITSSLILTATVIFNLPVFQQNYRGKVTISKEVNTEKIFLDKYIIELR